MIARRALVSSALAPVALIGGWTLAAGIQPVGYSSKRDTISALAAIGTPHRWVMSAGFIILGLSHLVTASGLRSSSLSSASLSGASLSGASLSGASLSGASMAGRVTLAVGGAASAVLAAVPLPAHGSSDAHVLVAGVAFGALGLWPALVGRNDSVGLLARRFEIPASLVLLAFVLSFLLAPTAEVGLFERIAAGAQALWPLAVVQSCRAVQRSKSTQ